MSTAQAEAALAADPVYRVLKASGPHRKADAAAHREKFMRQFGTVAPPVATLPSPTAAAPVSLRPTDLDGAMASLDAFHRANGLPPIAARNAKALPTRVSAPPLAAVPIAATPALTFEQQMQAGAEAARRHLHPEAMTIEQQALRAQAVRAERVQEEDRRATKAKAERQAGAEAARTLLGR